MTPLDAAPPVASRWQRFSAGFLRAYHGYAGWLVGISWWRFLLLSLLLLIASSVLQKVPPLSWTERETLSALPPAPPRPPKPVAVPQPPRPPEPAASGPAAETPDPVIRVHKGRNGERVEISVGDHGIRITKNPTASAASAAGGSPATPPSEDDAVEIRLPKGVVSEGVRRAVEEARREIADAVKEARDEAAADGETLPGAPDGPVVRIRTVRHGEFLTDLAFFWIVVSAIIKITYKRQIAAEAQAAQAVETAEAESLKRQVLEARMAAMQAQVEPHFLFNTLASIDHLIEVDPPRASQMQKHLIALLRASMPTMRETGDGANGARPRDLGRELAMVRPYLQILKMRMEERLTTEIDVPDGLLSAEFPPMMVQTLVENAIKHGLEPKPEGGRLTLKAEIVHGKLAVTVADTGLGFGKAPTAGTGVGLANIRERLQLLYGPKASLTLTENPGGGTRVTIAVPYKPVQDDA